MNNEHKNEGLVKMNSKAYLERLTANVKTNVSTLKKDEIRDMVLAGELPTIAKVGKESGKERVIAIIQAQIILIDKVMNLSRPLSVEAAEIIAEDLYDFVYPLSFEELHLFFKEFRQGKFKTTYQGLNSENLCKSAEDFINQRSVYFGSKSLNESNENKTRREREDLKDLTAAEIRERFNAQFKGTL